MSDFPVAYPERSLSFREELAQQRWDDHRYYHQSRINQSLHLFSALSFLCAYVLLFISPGLAVLMGWIVAMCSRQIGHFFFEPHHYDRINNASHQHKEDIKIGYNLKRKQVLHAIWGAIPIVLYVEPSLFGLMTPAENAGGYFHNVAIAWLVLAAAAIVFRSVQLTRVFGAQTGIVWATKILTDPFNDVRTYFKAPVYLMRGELLDPMTHVPSKLQSSEQV